MIEAGTLLIEKNAPRPECFHLVPGSDPNTWAPVAHDLSQRELDRALAANGWTFTYLAGAIHATAFGFSPGARAAGALKQLTAIAVEQRCNCLEIDTVAAHSFLGVPYLSVSAHSRNVRNR